jgi:aspartate 1-decarboxylase
MALASVNVRVAVTGVVSRGPTTTAAPVDADTPTAAGFTDLGYVSEDGVTETRDRSTNKIKAWQDAAIVREVVTEASLQYKFTLLETKLETLETYYGATVNAADGSVAVVPANTGGRSSYVIDVVDGSDYIRIYLPSAEVVEVGDQVYASGEAIGYELTITAYPGPAGWSAQKFYSSLAP